jgi:hypothetical protein
MSLFSKLFGAKSPARGPSNGGRLALPRLVADRNHLDVKHIFATQSSDTLREICRQLPVENLSFNMGMDDGMEDAILVCFAVGSHVARQRGVGEYADLIVPRLIARIEAHDPKKIYVTMRNEIGDFALALMAGARNHECLRCIAFIEQMVTGSGWPGLRMWTFAAHANIAWGSKNAGLIHTALDLVPTLSQDEVAQMKEVITGLQSRLAAL